MYAATHYIPPMLNAKDTKAILSKWASYINRRMPIPKTGVKGLNYELARACPATVAQWWRNDEGGIFCRRSRSRVCFAKVPTYSADASRGFLAMLMMLARTPGGLYAHVAPEEFVQYVRTVAVKWCRVVTEFLRLVEVIAPEALSNTNGALLVNTMVTEGARAIDLGRRSVTGSKKNRRKGKVCLKTSYKAMMRTLFEKCSDPVCLLEWRKQQTQHPTLLLKVGLHVSVEDGQESKDCNADDDVLEKLDEDLALFADVWVL